MICPFEIEGAQSFFVPWIFCIYDFVINVWKLTLMKEIWEFYEIYLIHHSSSHLIHYGDPHQNSLTSAFLIHSSITFTSFISIWWYSDMAFVQIFRTVEITCQELFASFGAPLISLSILHMAGVGVWVYGSWMT